MLATLKQLKAFPVGEDLIRKGLGKVIENTGLLGRWQLLGEHPKIICDTAHNPDGLELALGQLLQEPYSTLHMVIGFVKDKPLEKVLPLFPKEARYYFACPDIPRGLDAEILREKASDYGLFGKAYPSVRAALRGAREASGTEDLIYVGGSTFVVAEVV